MEEEVVVAGPVVCPPQPTGLTAAAQDSGAVVSWDDVRAVVESELAALAEDGVEDLPAAADVVTDIQVTVTAVGDASDEQVLTVAGDATQVRVSGLRNGVKYTVSVVALGEFGAGPVSESIVFSPTTGVEGEIGGVLLKRDDAAKTVPASQSASTVDGVAVTDDGEALEGVDKVALSEAVDVTEGEAIARTIEAQPEVQWAEPDLVVLPSTTSAADAEAVASAAAGWNITGEYGVGQVTDPDAGAGVTVAVIDTGITSHPDLDGRLVAGFDFVSNPEVLAAPRTEGGQPVPFDGDYADEATYGALGRDADPTDPGDWRGLAPVRDSSWHGTHTAGVIADVVPGAKIQPIRALSWRGGLLSDVAAGITWASGGTVDGAPANATPSKVINLSFSVQAACPNTLQTAIDDAVARGSAIVAAAGNNNADATGYAPGNCANVITVGASNAEGKRASYSNYGTVVDASAPGATPRTAREGTSIAAAHTAAALALIASQQPDLTPDQLAAELTGTYLRAFPGDTCDDAGDKSCGAGIVQIASGPVPFTCEPKLYQSATQDKESRLYVYDPVTNTYSTVGGNTGANPNGMGYNTADNFIYGVDTKLSNPKQISLFQLDSTGTYRTKGALAAEGDAAGELIDLKIGGGGDFWGPNRLLVSGSDNNWKSIDISDPNNPDLSDPDNPVVTDFTLTGADFRAADFTVLGNTAYGLNNTQPNNTLQVVNLITQVVSHKTTSGDAGEKGFGAAYSDALGNVYFHSNGGSVYRILAEDIDDPNPRLTSMGAATTQLGTPNDGASCPNAGSAFSATISNQVSEAVTANSAQLEADVNPNTPTGADDTAAATTAVVCFGTTSATSGGALQGCTRTPQFDNASDDDPLRGSSVTGLMPLTVDDLTDRTTYYWQVVAENSFTTTYGSVASFTTTGAPISTTQSASNVSTTTATLNGLVDPGNHSTTVDFCYGTSSDLVGCQPTDPVSVSGTAETSVTRALTGLTPGQRYFAQVRAKNDDGSASGSIVSFTTLDVPSVSLGSTSDVTSTDARLNASVDPKGLSTDVEFCYGTESNLANCDDPEIASESPLVAVNTSVDVTADLTGLSPSTTYYVRVTADNSNGTANSSIGSFTTSARPLVLTTTTGSLTTGTVGTVYFRTLSADGGTAPY
ncbi:MAG TPA: S8 family serine peptidase, partial [Candidatus Nanopelagicales bacterium]|nr:S8 family serine peptidase [Candidatus Nanopelagicales bacterium]